MKLIYPDRRQISDDEVISWARDLRVTDAMNGRTDGGDWVSVSTKFENGCTTITTIVKDPTLDEAVAELSDTGVATFARDDA